MRPLGQFKHRAGAATLSTVFAASLAVFLTPTTTAAADATAQVRPAATDPATNPANPANPAADPAVAVDVAAAAGLGTEPTRTWSAAPTDFNGDGTQDVLVGYHGAGSKLWRNEGNGNYGQVAGYAWQPDSADRHGCAWADVDRNGRKDVYCAVGRGRRNLVKRMGKDGELWLQGPHGGFREVGTEWRVGDPCGRGRFVAFLHVNRDRYPDLFVGNAGQRATDSDPCDSGRGVRNEKSKLFINAGGKGFRYAPDYMRTGAGPGARCAIVLDFNGDGRDDLFACMNGATPRLFVSTRRRGMVNVTDDHRFDWGVTDADVADLDRDGDPDIITSSPDVFGYHLNRNGRFGPRRFIARVGDGTGRSVAVGDVDADRDPDVYGMVGGGSTGNNDDWIWLNDGLEFSRVPVPSATGDAEDVVALRPWGGRRAAFLVLNGRDRATGPVQLVRVVRPKV